MLPDKLQKIRTYFIVFIQLRKSSNPISSQEIENHFELCGSEVREIIEDLRNDGYPIANTLRTEKGKKKIYFWADSWEEMKDTIHDLEGRAFKMLKTCSNQRKKFGTETQEKLF